MRGAGGRALSPRAGLRSRRARARPSPLAAARCAGARRLRALRVRPRSPRRAGLPARPLARLHLPGRLAGLALRREVAVYAVPNNGGWYDFGYFLGIVVFGVGARKTRVVYRDRVAARRRRRRPARSRDERAQPGHASRWPLLGAIACRARCAIAATSAARRNMRAAATAAATRSASLARLIFAPLPAAALPRDAGGGA